eukprot:gnl/Spiro4/6150_TR3163_c0_g1_i1.p1 gnl/Spiro4/6150_TR3163_c0_g1~~gnl/Spiro4/6150_TR3163_c0_g1_i1.p1  ORF type:complete len:853 (-),score=136.98 gnl/Spiro4/6150_TR3163_c0_g1_i1:24-2582(-)
MSRRMFFVIVLVFVSLLVFLALPYAPTLGVQTPESPLLIIPGSLSIPLSVPRNVRWLEMHPELDDRLTVSFHISSDFPVPNAARLKFSYGPRENFQQFACGRVEFRAVGRGVVSVGCEIRTKWTGVDLAFSVWKRVVIVGEVHEEKWNLLDRDTTLFTLAIWSNEPTCPACPTDPSAPVVAVVTQPDADVVPSPVSDASFVTIVRHRTQIGQLENLVGSLQFHRPDALVLVYLAESLCHVDVQLQIAAWRNTIVRTVLCLADSSLRAANLLSRLEPAYAVRDAFTHLGEQNFVTEGARNTLFLVSSNVELWRADLSQFTIATTKSAGGMFVNDVRTQGCSPAVHGLSRSIQLPTISHCLDQACPRGECARFADFIADSSSNTPSAYFPADEDVGGECLGEPQTVGCVTQQPHNEPTFYVRPVSYGQPFRSWARKRRPFFVFLVGVDHQLEVFFRVFEYWSHVMPCDPKLDVDGSGDTQYPYQRPALVIAIMPAMSTHTRQRLNDSLNRYPQVRQCFGDVVFYDPKMESDDYSKGPVILFPRILYEDDALAPLLRDHDYFMWMELDVIPLRHRWLLKLYRETALDPAPFWAKGSLYSGVGVDQRWDFSIFFHTNGNGLWSTHHEFIRFVRSERDVGKWLEGDSYPRGKVGFDLRIGDYLVDMHNWADTARHWHKYRFVRDFMNLGQALLSVKEFREFHPTMYFVHNKYRLPCEGFPLTFSADAMVMNRTETWTNSFRQWFKEWPSDADLQCRVPRSITQQHWCGFSHWNCPCVWPQEVISPGLLYREPPDLVPQVFTIPGQFPTRDRIPNRWLSFVLATLLVESLAAYLFVRFVLKSNLATVYRLLANAGWSR